jgi:hypothetical protein
LFILENYPDRRRVQASSLRRSGAGRKQGATFPGVVLSFARSRSAIFVSAPALPQSVIAGHGCISAFLIFVDRNAQAHFTGLPQWKSSSRRIPTT